MKRIGLLLVLALASCSKSEPAHDPPSAAMKPGKDPEAARRLIAANAAVIDVRSPDEYADAHLPSAANIPVTELGARLAEVDKLVESDKSRPIVVYCAAGGRAAKAKTQLEAAGYTHVVNGGGFDDLSARVEHAK